MFSIRRSLGLARVAARAVAPSSLAPHSRPLTFLSSTSPAFPHHHASLGRRRQPLFFDPATGSPSGLMFFSSSSSSAAASSSGKKPEDEDVAPEHNADSYVGERERKRGIESLRLRESLGRGREG